MAVKSVKLITISISRSAFGKLESAVKKTRRSKFISDLIEKELDRKEDLTLGDVTAFWTNLAKQCPRKTSKTAIELQREDRLSH